jgi:nucleoside-diphosphate-sugar epimerase
MRILIVGGTSSVGSALLRTLPVTDTVITAGRKNCDIKLDLSDPASKFSFPSDLDVIIHTASQFGIHTDKEILDTEEVNVVGTLKLCQVAVQSGAKHFVLISSIYSVLERHAKNYNFYALSKRQAEEVATLYCSNHNLPLTILRPSPLYGSDDKFRVHQPFLYTMIDKAQKGEDITLYGSNDASKNYLHIDDLTEIITRVIRMKMEGTYACSNTTDVTYSQIAKAAFETFKKGGNVYFLKDKPDIRSDIFEKNYSLYDKIGFYPRISIEEGFKRLANSRASIK